MMTSTPSCRIQAVDHRKDLFSISEIISQELMRAVAEEVLGARPYTKQEWQEHKPRKKLQRFPGCTLSLIHEHIAKQKDTIGEALGQDINSIETAFWYDQEGFDFPAHIDNPGVHTVMQIYLSDCAHAGTVFYNIQDHHIETRDDKYRWHYTGPKQPESVRKNFEFKANTGYLMINNSKQLHGVPGMVGKGDVRLSCYCHLN